MRAINPKEMPPLPDGANHWSRSTKRSGGMYHAHTIGFPVCGAKVVLERHHSKGADSVGDMRWWGVCPRCYAKAMKSPRKDWSRKAARMNEAIGTIRSMGWETDDETGAEVFYVHMRFDEPPRLTPMLCWGAVPMLLRPTEAALLQLDLVAHLTR
jgi:hypothetical protein